MSWSAAAPVRRPRIPARRGVVAAVLLLAGLALALTQVGHPGEAAHGGAGADLGSESLVAVPSESAAPPAAVTAEPPAPSSAWAECAAVVLCCVILLFAAVAPRRRGSRTWSAESVLPVSAGTARRSVLVHPTPSLELLGVRRT